MGISNSTGLDNGMQQNINQEFERIRTDSAAESLSVSEIIKFQHPENYPFTLQHLGNLFVLDQNKDGKFTLQESQLQATTTLLLWNTLNQRLGEQIILDWITKLFSENQPLVYFEQYPDIAFIRIETVKVMHEIFQVKLMNGIDIQTFFNLLQECGEERGMMALEDEEFDEFCPLPVAQDFVREFLKGFQSLMQEIGFDTYQN